MKCFGTLLVAGLLGCTQSSGPDLGPAERQSIVAAIRTESDRMLDAMRTRDIDAVLAFYGKRTAYVGEGEIGDWDAIVKAAPPRYAGYTKVECSWPDPFRVDVLSATSAVVTAVLHCEKADSSRRWVERTARTEVMAIEDGRWRIVAVHESQRPGGEGLR